MTKYLTPSKLKYYDTLILTPKLTALDTRVKSLEEDLEAAVQTLVTANQRLTEAIG